jgi:hypothetical protein
MNAIPVPGRKFTAYFVVASCHSVSNHVMHTTGLFCRHLSFLQRRFIGCRRSRFRLPLLRELGLELRVSRYSCTLTRCTPPNRVHFQAHRGLFITDWQFASSCFPRSDFAAAVTFSYRSVDVDLTGTFAPLRQRLRSRTTEPLRGRGNGALVAWSALAKFLSLAGKLPSHKSTLPAYA